MIALQVNPPTDRHFYSFYSVFRPVDVEGTYQE
jgi:hypothetical protein